MVGVVVDGSRECLRVSPFINESWMCGELSQNNIFIYSYSFFTRFSCYWLVCISAWNSTWFEMYRNKPNLFLCRQSGNLSSNIKNLGANWKVFGELPIWNQTLCWHYLTSHRACHPYVTKYRHVHVFVPIPKLQIGDALPHYVIFLLKEIDLK